MSGDSNTQGGTNSITRYLWLLIKILVIFITGAAILDWLGIDPGPVLDPVVRIFETIVNPDYIGPIVSPIVWLMSLVISAIIAIVRLIMFVIISFIIGVLGLGLVIASIYYWKRQKDIVRDALLIELETLDLLDNRSNQEIKKSRELDPDVWAQYYLTNQDKLSRLTDRERKEVMRYYSRVIRSISQDDMGYIELSERERGEVIRLLKDRSDQSTIKEIESWI